SGDDRPRTAAGRASSKARIGRGRPRQVPAGDPGPAAGGREAGRAGRGGHGEGKVRTGGGNAPLRSSRREARGTRRQGAGGEERGCGERRPPLPSHVKRGRGREGD